MILEWWNEERNCFWPLTRRQFCFPATLLFIQKLWQQSEADKFAEIAAKMGVPRENILIKNKLTDTGENIRFSYRLLKKKNIKPQSIILMREPYIKRRAYTIFQK